MENHEVRIFRFCIWVFLMCVVGSITGLVAPHKFLFVPAVFMLLFVPMVLMPVHRRRRGEQPSDVVRKESNA